MGHQQPTLQDIVEQQQWNDFVGDVTDSPLAPITIARDDPRLMAAANQAFGGDPTKAANWNAQAGAPTSTASNRQSFFNAASVANKEVALQAADLAKNMAVGYVQHLNAASNTFYNANDLLTRTEGFADFALTLGMVAPFAGQAASLTGRILVGAVSQLERFGFFGVNALSEARQVANITRVSSNIANEPFITEAAKAKGWNPPYPPNIDIRQITLGKETQFVRLFTGNDPNGQFLARYKEIEHIIDNPVAIRIHLGLRETPTSIADVNVPSGTKLYVGPIGPQPKFGLSTKSGFQYQLQDWIPPSSFQNIRSLQELNNDFYLKLNR